MLVHIPEIGFEEMKSSFRWKNTETELKKTLLCENSKKREKKKENLKTQGLL